MPQLTSQELREWYRQFSRQLYEKAPPKKTTWLPGK